VFVLTADEESGRPYIVMELMPGQTLKDLVGERGPLEAQEAIAKILDVIEGLQEAHRLGIIHRDVKPSNCYLDAEGRVKIGDFGLSKSLTRDVQLTQSGRFLGTPVYASPEQIRKDPLDVRTDVYSVAATFYYLLAGKAPFEMGDAAAALARIVSESAPPLRPIHPDIPKALEKVILRGLERDRQKRWQDLEEFRQALLPFLPERVSIASVGLRVAAWLIDYALFLPLTLLLELDLFAPLLGLAQSRGLEFRFYVILTTLWLAYFTLVDGLWGGSVGKRAFGLRVWPAHGIGAPGLGKAIVRTLAYFTLIELAQDIAEPLAFKTEDFTWWELIYFFSPLAGLLLFATPMRARNGYRGLHDWVSGTRVVQLPPEESLGWARFLPSRHGKALDERIFQPAEMPDRVGAYVVRGALEWTDESKLLLGEDPMLERRVLIHLRPASEPALPPLRRDLARSTRLRWLAEGTQNGLRWDAFVAPAGSPLSELVVPDKPLRWPQARPILKQLTDELTAASADGTLPRLLTLGQVWLAPTGRVQLVDHALAPSTTSEQPEGSADEGSLKFLREVALLTLEGRLPEPKLPAVGTIERHIQSRRVKDRALRIFQRSRERTQSTHERDEVVCSQCHRSVWASFETTNFGFRRFVCPACGKWFTYPMAVKGRVIAWLVLAAATMIVVMSMVFGRPWHKVRPRLVLIGLGCALYALIKDAYLRARIDHARLPIRAAVPHHASAIFERLFGRKRACQNLGELQADLAATRDRPTHVNPRLRTAQLGVLVALVGIPVAMMATWSRSVGILEVEQFDQRIQPARALRQILDDEKLVEKLRTNLNPASPAARILAEPDELRSVLAGHLLRQIARRDARIASLGPGHQLWAAIAADESTKLTLRGEQQHLEIEPSDDPAIIALVKRRNPDGRLTIAEPFRLSDYLGCFEALGEPKVSRDADGRVTLSIRVPLSMNRGLGEWNEIRAEAVGMVLATLFAFPSVFGLAALIFRGGLSYRLAGLALVRWDGQKALRVQCALRALMVWTPVMALLIASAVVELQCPEAVATYWGLWWAALVLLPAYSALALRFPGRGLHDVLARTYPVPR
jgi:hypothetical protein